MVEKDNYDLSSLQQISSSSTCRTTRFRSVYSQSTVLGGLLFTGSIRRRFRICKLPSKSCSSKSFRRPRKEAVLVRAILTLPSCLYHNLTRTSVAPWQNVVYVKLLGQESSGSDCNYSQRFVFWVEFKLDCKEFGLPDSSGLKCHAINTLSKLVGRNYLNLWDAV